jgi:hypothetical protein
LEGCSFPRAFEKREKNFFIQGNFYEKFESYIKRSCKLAALFIGASVGEPGGASFAGALKRRKKRSICGFLFLDPEDIESLSVRPIWNFSKEQGSPELISDYGAQRACL